MAAIIPASTWGRTLRGTPPRFDLSRLQEMTVHYTGAQRVNRSETQIASYLKAIERSHMARPEMSAVGYNFAVDKSGRIWELRGWTHRNAANGTGSNVSSFSVLVLVGVEDNAPTTPVIQALQSLYAEGVRRAGRPLIVKGHQEHKATACPGPALMSLVRSGQIQRGVQAPQPAPKPPAPTTRTYTVVRGDSYWAIAARLLGSGARWKEISDLNGGRTLTPGQTIRVPSAGVTSPPNRPAAPAPAPAPVFTTYRVVSGDSYWRISTKLYKTGTRWMEISDLNGGRALHPGAVLQVRAA
jgi:LysM repeat protein